MLLSIVFGFRNAITEQVTGNSSELEPLPDLHQTYFLNLMICFLDNDLFLY